MALRTATYKSTSLGDYVVPVQEGNLDIGTKFNLPHSVKQLFESNNPSVRFMGNATTEIIMIFAKDVAQSPSQNTDMLMRTWYQSLRSTFFPTAGSETAGSLVITDSVTSETYANAYMMEMDAVRNIAGLLYVKALFLVKGS